MVSVTKGWFVWLTSPSENVKHYYTIIVAITFFFVAQLLTCAWDQPFWAKGIDFPGQIVAMVFVWLVMCAAQELFSEPGRGLEKFYHEYIRAPTEVLNKHMSIGFTVPFMNLIDQPPVKARQIGLLTAAFLVTGVLNSIFVYAVAYHVQLASTKITCRLRRNPVLDVEAARGQTTAIAAEPPQRLLLRGALWNIDRCDNANLRGGAEEHSRLDRFRKHISDVSTLCTISGYISDSNGSKLAYNDESRGGTNENEHDQRGHGAPIPSAEASAPRISLLNKFAVVVCSWLSQNVFLTLSLLIMLPVGLPMSFFRQNDLYLDLGLLFTVWLSFTSAQMRTKQQTSLGHRHKKTLAAAATLLNPVLWTSLFLVCYGLAKSSIRNQPSADVVAGFSTDNTVSDLIAHHIDSSATDARNWSHLGSIPIGAGDVATSILNAGIVSWGLKLFEYRHQIVSSGGFTVVITSLLASLLNVVAWPLLAHAMGVRPASSDLSFAARSVTIALGGPAMKSLGGDAGVNAVGVVVNGICFQLVAGFLAAGGGFAAAGGRCNETSIRCGWTGLVRHGKIGETRELDSLTPYSCREGGRGTQMTGSQTDHDREVRYSSDATHFGEQRPDYQNDEISWGVTHAAANIDITSSSNTGRTVPPQVHESVISRLPSVVPTVAAGVTIGINAAAMGTAHLYEQNSQAAPYSALSMTMFGVFTVLFAVRGPMTEWIVTRVGG